MTRLAVVVILCAVVAMIPERARSAGPSPAPSAPAQGTDPGNAAAGALMDEFAGACLLKFPDDHAVLDHLREQQYQPESDAWAKANSQGGRVVSGWVRKDQKGAFQIVLETKPAHLCRANTIFKDVKGLDIMFQLAVQTTVAATMPGTTTQVEPLQSGAGPDGRPVQRRIITLKTKTPSDYDIVTETMVQDTKSGLYEVFIGRGQGQKP
jgi:hypothetical protein